MIKEHQAPGKGVGGVNVSGTSNRTDSSPTKTTDGGTSPLTSGGDPLDAHHPKSVPAHMSELKRHSGDKVVKGGSSQAGSVGGYQGK